MASRQGQQLSTLRPLGGELNSYRTGRGSRKYTPSESDCDLHIAPIGKRKRLRPSSTDEDDLVGLEQPVRPDIIFPAGQDTLLLPREAVPGGFYSTTHSSALAGQERSSAVQYQEPVIYSDSSLARRERQSSSPVLFVQPQEVVYPTVPPLIGTPQIPCELSAAPHPELVVAPQIPENIVRPVGMFGVVFPHRSYPMDASKFLQVDPLHWLLDMTMIVGEGYEEMKEMCIFLLNEFSLPADKALAVYVQAPGTEFLYRGAVHAASPSAVLSLLWPKRGGEGQMQLTGADCPPLTAKIGISVEDTASLPVVNVGLQSRVEEMALKVGENLFNFMQSFCNVESDKLVVPMDILDRWFKKFQDRAKKDARYLNRFSV